jgi:hypothetical protein
METILCVCLGIGLAAACGFRVFVPFLIMSIASLSGHLQLAHGFEWIGTYPALITFSVATALEIAGYYIPWVDHLLDTVATPAAVVAGIIVTASVVSGMSPLLKWGLAVIAGGTAAGVVQGTTVLVRGASTLTTGGLANPLFATAELASSISLSVVALVAPLLVIVLLALFFVFFGRKAVTRLFKNKTAVPPVIGTT